MKRWKQAKKQGLNWQVVLIQDCETDIKLITLDSVKRGEDYGTVNKKVVAEIKGCINELKSDNLKQMVKNTMPLFASRVYFNK